MKFDLPDSPFVYQNLINGEWCASEGEETYQRISPAHDVAVGTYPFSNEVDIERAIGAASACHRSCEWSDQPGAERGAILRKVAMLIRDQKDELALIETLESGKPIGQALDEMQWAANLWDYAATLCQQLCGDVNTNLGTAMHAFMYRQPIGVVGMITPWNFPLLIVSQKLPFALAAGCTAVIKPSEFTPGTTFKLGEICLRAGVPAGAINIVSGYGEPVGRVLSESPIVDMISFTGSTAVGKKIVAASRHNLKKVSLELGGKNPQIIFSDADLDAAVDAVVFGVYFNMGECCNSGSRILIHEDIADEFIGRVVAHARKVKVGDPLDPTVKIGAIINDTQVEKIMSFIDSGRDHGANVALGGNMIDSEKGRYVAPTIFTEVSPEMPIAKEEIFGPVLSVIKFRSLDEAIDIANDTVYGLSASVWTKDIDTALIASRKIEAGTVWVNNFMSGYPEISFGGLKQSGLGRELGRFSLDEFTELKSVLIHLGPKSDNWVE